MGVVVLLELRYLVGREGVYRGNVLFDFVEVTRRLIAWVGMRVCRFVWFHTSREKRRSPCGGERGKNVVWDFYWGRRQASLIIFANGDTVCG